MAETSSKHILIVEDDEDIVDLLVTVLREHFNRIDIAGNGSEALEKVRATPDYDLIISDLNMPRMGGARLYKEIEAIDPKLARRMLFISGEQSGSQILLDGKENPFIYKPFGIKELRETIAAFFNKQHDE